LILFNEWLRQGEQDFPELAEALDHAWSAAEFPGRAFGDFHRTSAVWVKMFRSVGYLVDGAVHAPPTEAVRLYRGAPPAVRAGLSWTDKLDQARWFARRNGLFGFESDVWTMLAPSSVLLAQANGRGEGEYVVSALDAEDVIEHVEVVEADPDGRAVPNTW
jgi:hypothetical protein